jgi:sec-independent protein translocase protein TatA
MGFDQPVHWVVVAVVAAMLFGGYKKMPEMARSAGRSLRIFKTEMKGLADDDEVRAASTAAPAATPVQVAAPAQVSQVATTALPVAVPVTPQAPTVIKTVEPVVDPTAPPAV